MNELRILTGAVIAPWAALVYIAVSDAIHGGNWSFNFEVSWFSVLAVLVSYFTFFLAGVPLLVLLRRIGFLNLPALVFSGALSGAVMLNLVLILVSYLLHSEPIVRFRLTDILEGAGLGASVALAFGLIAGITSCSSRRREAPHSLL